jgi:hypothetical protein
MALPTSTRKLSVWTNPRHIFHIGQIVQKTSTKICLCKFTLTGFDTATVVRQTYTSIQVTLRLIRWQNLCSLLLRRALVSTTELKYLSRLQSRLQNQVNPHGVQGWLRYVISLLKDLCTTLLDQSFYDGKETRNTTRRATRL